MLYKNKNLYSLNEMVEIFTNLILITKEMIKKNKENPFSSEHTLKHTLMLFETELYYIRCCKDNTKFLYNQNDTEYYYNAFKIFKISNRNDAIDYQFNLYEKITTLVNQTRGKEPFLFKYYHDMSFPAYNQLRLLQELDKDDIEKCNNEKIMCVLTDNGDWYLMEM